MALQQDNALQSQPEYVTFALFFIVFGLAVIAAVLMLLKFMTINTDDENRDDFRWRRWGSSLPGLRTLDPPRSPPSTPAEIVRCTCLQSHLQTSPPTPQKSYLKFRNPRTTFENAPLSAQKCHSAEGRGVPDFFDW